MALTPERVGLSEVNRAGVGVDEDGVSLLCYAGRAKNLGLLSGAPGLEWRREWGCVALPVTRENLLLLETVGGVEEATDEYVRARNISLSTCTNFVDSYPYSPEGEPPPFQHQRDAFAAAQCLFESGGTGFGNYAQMGCGKTRMAIDLMRVYTERCALVVVQNSTALQWADNLSRLFPEAETLVLTGMPIPKRKAILLGLRRKEGHPLQVVVVNWEALAKLRDHLARIGFDVMVADECFIAGTLVDTPNGPTPIEKLNVGDTVVGPFGRDTITGVSSKFGTEIAIVRYGGYTAVCSANHLWLTTQGFKEAQHLKRGDALVDGESVRILRSANAGSRMGEESISKASVLQQILLSEMEGFAAGNEGEVVRVRTSGKCVEGAETLVCREFRLGSEATATGHPDEQQSKSRVNRKDAANAVDYGSSSEGSRGQWSRTNSAPSNFVQPVRRWLDLGTSSSNEDKTGGIPDKLQTGYRAPDFEDRNRSRWGKPWKQTTPGTRSEEGRKAGGIGVESVEVYQQGSPEFYQYSNGKDHIKLYDLSIKNCPVFLVNGVVVHNCTRLKDRNTGMSKAAFHVGQTCRYRYAMTGTPLGNSPEDLWGIYRFLDDKVFGTRYWAFAERYFKLGGFTGRQFVGFVPEHLPEFINKMYGCAYRITKSCITDMPEKCYEVVRLTMGGEQKALYDKVVKDMWASRVGEDGETRTLSVANALVLVTRLQQVTAGLFPSNEGEIHCEAIPSVKTEWVTNYVSDAVKDGQAQLVVWCRFTKEIEVVVAALREREVEAGVIAGSVKMEKREALRVAFNDRENPLRVLVCQTQAAAYGLDLPNADTMVFHTNSYSFLERSQAEDRGHRLGRLRPYNIIDVAVKGTVDVEVLAALKEKGDLASLLLTKGFLGQGVSN